MAAELPARPSWRDRCWMLGHPLVLVGWLVVLAFLANELWKVRATSMLGRALHRLLEKPQPALSSYTERNINPLGNPFPDVWVPTDGDAFVTSSDQSADVFLEQYNGRGGELWQVSVETTRLNDPVLFIWRTRVVQTWEVRRISSVQHFPDEAAIRRRVIEAIIKRRANDSWAPLAWRTGIIESPTTTTSYIRYDYRGIGLNIVGLINVFGLVAWCVCVPAWHRRARLRRAACCLVRGFCPVCHYDIAACAATGLAFRCPECGTLNPRATDPLLSAPEPTAESTPRP